MGTSFFSLYSMKSWIHYCPIKDWKKKKLADYLPTVSLLKMNVPPAVCTNLWICAYVCIPECLCIWAGVNVCIISAWGCSNSTVKVPKGQQPPCLAPCHIPLFYCVSCLTEKLLCVSVCLCLLMRPGLQCINFVLMEKKCVLLRI